MACFNGWDVGGVARLTLKGTENPAHTLDALRWRVRVDELFRQPHDLLESGEEGTCVCV